VDAELRKGVRATRGLVVLSTSFQRYLWVDGLLFGHGRNTVDGETTRSSQDHPRGNSTLSWIEKRNKRQIAVPFRQRTYLNPIIPCLQSVDKQFSYQCGCICALSFATRMFQGTRVRDSTPFACRTGWQSHHEIGGKMTPVAHLGNVSVDET